MGLLALQRLISRQRRRRQQILDRNASVNKRKGSPCQQDTDGDSQAAKIMRCSIPDLPEEIEREEGGEGKWRSPAVFRPYDLQDSDSLIQKRAYKVLSMLFKDAEFIERNLDVLLELMISSLPCQFPLKRYRLECLHHLIVYVLKDPFKLRKREIVSSFLTGIFLALKEANKKTRNRAYDLLIQIGRACEDAENDGRKENLHQFFGMVADGLAGQTPYAISAAMTGLARLTYEFSELIGVAYELLPLTFLLVQRNNREIVKGVVEGLLSWQSDTKNSFKAKVKSLVEILVKKCGLDVVKAVMPEEHMNLVTNIRKINERKM